MPAWTIIAIGGGKAPALASYLLCVWLDGTVSTEFAKNTTLLSLTRTLAWTELDNGRKSWQFLLTQWANKW